VLRRIPATLVLSLTVLLLFAAPVLAGDHDGGEGWWGETDDKVVTNAGFILIAAFPLFVFLMSLLQWRLDKRKEARKAAAKARGSRAEWRGGW
jgi:hypothetical protein